MFGTVAFAPRSLGDFASLLDEQQREQIERAAEPLRGLRVLNLSVLGYGAALTDLLAVQTPLLQHLGVAATWQTVRSADEFTPVNRTMYAALGGRDVTWNDHCREVWRRYTRMNAGLFSEPQDVVVVHDPQPAAVILTAREQVPDARWVFHCHLDLAGAQRDVWSELESAIAAYDAVVFDHSDFLPPGFQHPNLHIIPPGIDPLGPRSMPLDQHLTAELLRRHGLDSARPLVAQIGPLDEESDALGAIDAYDALAGRYPDLQLLLVATHLTEDTRTRAYFERVSAAVALRPAVSLLLTDLHEIGNVELNAFQRASNVILHKSLRRGFGLWIAESMWKERPVVAGRAGGLPLQVEDEVTGYLVGTTEEAIHRIDQLLEQPARAAELGRAGRARVRDHFLVTRVLADYLSLFGSLTAAGVVV